MKWYKELPDVSTWQPQSKNNDTLSNALAVTCQLAQNRITSRSKAEIRFNINNFDSGSGVEEIVREEVANLLPERYSVDSGVVNDRNGKTAGDCDLVIRDRIWSPAIKLGATKSSRRYHFPIEGIYSAVEIKQTLGFQELDDAMMKLVTLARLERPDNPYGHITENQHLTLFDVDGTILNPLQTTVFATGLRDGLPFHDIVQRFGRINASLSRKHMVNMLCILDAGTAWYSVESGTPYNASYMKDRQQALILQENHGEPENAFYRFFVDLLGHLTRSVLYLVDISAEYGNPPPPRQVITYNEAAFNQDTQ